MNKALSGNRSIHLRSPLDWGRAACDALMFQFAPALLPPEGRWHYHQGVFLYGMTRVWEQTKDEKYYRYMKEYVDDLVDDCGNLLFNRDELDSIQAGLLLFGLHRETGEDKYRKAADKLLHVLGTLNQTTEGGYWHKDKYPHQMWLDGLYMGGVFAMRYGHEYGEPQWADRVLHQERLMRKHMKDEATGLLYHAWDESRQAPWSDPATGCSPEFWGRSIGWYGMALADFIGLLPANHPGRRELSDSLRELLAGLIRFQDPASGLWHQVVNRGDRQDNWLESSCTSLFVYAMAKAVKQGCAPEGCVESMRKAFDGLLRRMRFDEGGRLIVPDICIGTPAGDYANYISRPVSYNDLHGVGAFVLACVEMEELRSEDGRAAAEGGDGDGLV